MANVNVHIDMRPYTAKIRQVIKNKYIKSVNSQGVKAEIYNSLYTMIVDTIPEDTGALKYSPLSDGSPEYMGDGKRSKAPHHALGNIDDKGIYFSPYAVSKKTGKQTYYASNVKDFRPYIAINDNKNNAYENIKDIIVREMNDGQK
jgi:hypothetical protein